MLLCEGEQCHKSPDFIYFFYVCLCHNSSLLSLFLSRSSLFLSHFSLFFSVSIPLPPSPPSLSQTTWLAHPHSLKINLKIKTRTNAKRFYSSKKKSNIKSNAFLCDWRNEKEQKKREKMKYRDQEVVEEMAKVSFSLQCLSSSTNISVSWWFRKGRINCKRSTRMKRIKLTFKSFSPSRKKFLQASFIPKKFYHTDFFLSHGLKITRTHSSTYTGWLLITYFS